MTRRVGQDAAPLNVCSGPQTIRLSWSLEVLIGSLANENRSCMPLLLTFPVCSRLPILAPCTVFIPLSLSLYLISHRSFFGIISSVLSLLSCLSEHRRHPSFLDASHFTPFLLIFIFSHPLPFYPSCFLLPVPLYLSTFMNSLLLIIV